MRDCRANRRTADKLSETELMSVGEEEKSGPLSQTAQAMVSHRGRPVTRLHFVASWSAGQKVDSSEHNDFHLTGHNRVHIVLLCTCAYSTTDGHC